MPAVREQSLINVVDVTKIFIFRKIKCNQPQSSKCIHVQKPKTGTPSNASLFNARSDDDAIFVFPLAKNKYLIKQNKVRSWWIEPVNAMSFDVRWRNFKIFKLCWCHKEMERKSGTDEKRISKWICYVLYYFYVTFSTGQQFCNSSNFRIHKFYLFCDHKQPYDD